MILTVEYNQPDESIEIFCDKEGLDLLLRKLEVLKEKGGHVHLMTESWAGHELTEERQGKNNELLNHLKIIRIDSIRT